jgi:hypothetical protein
MTHEELNAELTRVRAENDALRSKVTSPKPISMKVGEKGGVSVYGLGRFPVTLYASQWRRLLAESVEISAFIDANAGRLSEKG